MPNPYSESDFSSINPHAVDDLLTAQRLLEDAAPAKQALTTSAGERQGSALSGIVSGLFSPLIAQAAMPSKTRYDGFDQPAPRHESGILDSITQWFVQTEPTLEDKLRNLVENQLNAREKEALEQEHKKLSEWQDETFRTSLLSMAGPKWPVRPQTPMHNEVEKRLQTLEGKITSMLFEEMSLHERERLGKQLDQYKRQPHSEMPNALKDYYDRLQETTEQILAVPALSELDHIPHSSKELLESAEKLKRQKDKEPDLINFDKEIYKW